jgi:Oxidoreductase family, NAD-binding Rossmann fold
MSPLCLEDDSVEAVFVIGPPAKQFEIGLRALEAGKHLFVEKPPADTLEQSRALECAAQANGVQCQVGFQKRFALGTVLPATLHCDGSSEAYDFARSTTHTGARRIGERT